MPRALEDDHGSFAVIDLVAHLYRGGADDRGALAKIWARYSDATVAGAEDERFRDGAHASRDADEDVSRRCVRRRLSDGARDARRDARETRGRWDGTQDGARRDDDEDGRAGRDGPTD